MQGPRIEATQDGKQYGRSGHGVCGGERRKTGSESKSNAGVLKWHRLVTEKQKG